MTDLETQKGIVKGMMEETSSPDEKSEEEWVACAETRLNPKTVSTIRRMTYGTVGSLWLGNLGRDFYLAEKRAYAKGQKDLIKRMIKDVRFSSRPSDMDFVERVIAFASKIGIEIES